MKKVDERFGSSASLFGSFWLTLKSRFFDYGSLSGIALPSSYDRLILFPSLNKAIFDNGTSFVVLAPLCETTSLWMDKANPSLPEFRVSTVARCGCGNKDQVVGGK